MTCFSALGGKDYTFEARGEVDIKGKGKMVTHFLKSRAAPIEVTVRLETPDILVQTTNTCQSNNSLSKAERSCHKADDLTPVPSVKKGHKSELCLIL